MLTLAEDLLDHDIEGRSPAALRLPDEAAQSLEILRGIAQAIDMIKPKPLQLVVRDQLLDQMVDRIERPGILGPQSRERVDVEKASVVDVAGGKPPMPQLVMLTFKQVVQGERLSRTAPASTIGGKPADDDVGGAGDAFQLRLEGRRLLPIGVTQAPVARAECENARACFAALRSSFPDDHPQDLAVALRGDRQAVLEIPTRKTALVGIIA